MPQMRYIFLGLALAIGIIIGAGIMYAFRGTQTTSVITRLGGYQFINPLLSCDINEDTRSQSLSPLTRALSNAASSLIRDGKVRRISVYVRDMNGGIWTGFNENDTYAPASLMKVPILITFLDEDSLQRIPLTTTYTLNESHDLNGGEYFKPAYPLSLGERYTVEQLLRAMIEQSDNNATQTLLDHADKADFASTFDAFGVPPVTDQNVDSISPKDYMRFFRIIYNATYLGRAQSLHALDMLAKIDFPPGLKAGLPDSVPIADKFGERTIEGMNGNVVKRELSDCGIVYYPQAPYGICVMAEGANYDDMAAAIATISSTTYSSVSSGVLNQ